MLTVAIAASTAHSPIELVAGASGILLLIAAAFVVFRTFREVYLLTWILGWSTFLMYQLASETAVAGPAWLGAVASMAFVAAVALFSTSLIFYSNAERRLRLVAALSAVSLVFGLWVGMSSSPSGLLIAAFHLSYVSIAITAAATLLQFTWGRRQIGAWVISITIIALHYDALAGTGTHFIGGLDTAIELLLGLSMLIVVLDDSKIRTDRLVSVTRIGACIAEANANAEMTLTTLVELRHLLGARAAWLRVIEGEHLVLAQQVGLAEGYLRARATIDAHDPFATTVIERGEALVLRAADADPVGRAALHAARFHHIVAVPVRGKKSVTGIIFLAQDHQRHYPADEIRFLTMIGNNVGLAAENLELTQLIQGANREWIRTFDSIEDVIFVHDSSNRILRLNRALLQRVGGDFREIIQRTCEEVLPGGGQRWHGCPYCHVPNFNEAPDPCFNGFSLVTTSSVSDASFPGVPGTIHVIRDTTGRHAAEDRYRLLFERAQEGVFVSTPDGQFKDCNDALVRMLGYESRVEVLSLDIAKSVYVNPDQRREFRTAIERDGYVRNFEIDLRRRDGSIITALENTFASNEDGNVRYHGFLLDVTEKKRAEDEIRRRNRQLHALNAITAVAAQSVDADEILQTAVEQLVALFSADLGSVWLLDPETSAIKRRAFVGQSSNDVTQLYMPAEFLESLRSNRVEFLTEKNAAELPGFLRDYAASESLRHFAWVLLWTKERPIGVLGIGSRSDRRFNDSDRSLLTALGRQLASALEKVQLYEQTLRAYDDLQRTQEQLLQSEKLRAMGQLVSGVAHELNNPLTAILGYAELLQGEALTAQMSDFTAKIVRQAQRTQRLVQNLLSFARQRKPEKKYVELAGVLQETIALRDYDFKRHDLTVETKFDSELPYVFADSHQLEQVFLNIVNNAVDSMKDAGRGGTLRVSLTQSGDRICAEFHDSGTGIQEPQKVFDPFYTTKPIGKGTGLGLSICYGIVKEHGGELQAFNDAEGGAIFRVILPAAAEKPTAGRDTLKLVAQPAVAGRVLVVDDEDAIREFESEVLARSGFLVVPLASGDEALARLECEEFQAVVLDTSLPGRWGGCEIYRWIALNRPGAERNIVLAASNITDDGVRTLVERYRVPHLAKPFQAVDLVKIVQEVVAKSQAAANGLK